MRRATARLALTLLVAVLAGCGKKGRNYDIPFDPSVPDVQVDSMIRDMERLKGLSLSGATEEDTRTLGVSDFSGGTLFSWLRERVKVIVGESYDFKKHYTVASSSSGLRPQIAAEGDEIVTVMENVGSYLYLVGTKASTVIDLDVNGSTVRINTPRVGIVRIGEGLFSGSRFPNTPVDGEVRSLVRLGVLFHEARHSDGNGAHVVFPHATCPSGTYANRSACENNSNGPYAVQYRLASLFYQNCGSCTAGELQALYNLLTDYKSRIFQGAQYRDPRPEVLR